MVARSARLRPKATRSALSAATVARSALSAASTAERYHIECIHTADAEFDGPKLKKTWRNKTPKDAYDVLKSNDIQVTN